MKVTILELYMSDCQTCKVLRDNPKYSGHTCPVCNATFEGKLTQKEYELRDLLDKNFDNTFPNSEFLARQLDGYADIKVIMYPPHLLDEAVNRTHFKLCTKRQFVKLFPVFKSIDLACVLRPVQHSSHTSTATYKKMTEKHMLLWFKCSSSRDWPNMNMIPQHSNCIICPLSSAMLMHAANKYGMCKK